MQKQNEEAAVSAPALIFTTDKDGTFNRVNSAFAEHSGYDTAALKGRHHADLWHPEMPGAVAAEMQQALEGGRAWMGVVRQRTATGSELWLDCYIAPILEHGSITGYQAVCSVLSPARHAHLHGLYARLRKGGRHRGLFSGCTSSRRRMFVAMAALVAGVVGVNALISGLALGEVLIELVAGVGLALGLGWWLSRRLCAAVQATLSECDSPIARQVYGGADDEVGQLRLSNRWQAARLRALVGRVTDYSERLNDAAQHVRAESDEAGRDARGQHSDIEQVAAAVNEMSATVQEVARHAAEAAKAAGVADEESNTGKLVIVETMGVIDELADGVAKAGEVIGRLEKDSVSIGKVLEVINGIAEQTNLLALNAAIEAARAGEQGRGFAVVADEVRTLATRTQASTEEISAMIERLQNGTREAVKAMAQGSEQAQQGVEQAEKAAETLAAIAGAVDTINRMNTQIANASEQQSAVADEINQNINHISERAEKTATGADNAAQSSEALCQLAGRLGGLIRTL